MAVPKKRTSKTKARSRKANWKREAYYMHKKAISLARSFLTTRSSSYLYRDYDFDFTQE